MKKQRESIGYRLLTGLSVALLLVGVINGMPVRAEEVQESITLSPPTKHLELTAGEVFQDEFTIINYGDVAYDFTVYTGPYSVKDEMYTPDFINQPTNADAYRWVSFEKALWHAEPKQTIHVPFTINVSKGATAGGHYGVIFVETQPKEAQSTGVARKKRLALLLYTTIKGPTETAGRVVAIDTPWLASVPPITSRTRVQNTGKTDFAAKTRFAVMDLFGNVKYQNEQEAYVLPSTTRAIEHSWDGATWLGVYKVHTETSVLGTLTQANTYVVVAPKWLLFLLALLLLIGLIHIMRRRNSGSTTDLRAQR